MVGKFETRRKGQRFTLLPISHVTQSAQIEVTLDNQGALFKATVIPKELSRTIVPATLDSANRAGSKIAPHFIHDKLFYVAGDYMKYGGDRKRSENYHRYIKQMEQWVNSQYSHRKLKLIYQYVQKGTLIEDLIQQNILFTDHDGKLIEKWTTKEDKKYGLEKPEIYKVVTGKSSEALVRFNILRETAKDLPVWEDKELYERFQGYLEYQMNQGPEAGVCYVSGRLIPLTDRHGSRLRNAGDMSKLISSNDSRGFTYRGRFERPEEAVQIGYDISQKAHNALRWLNQRQGYRSDTRHFITFGIKHPDTVQVFNSTADLYNDPLFMVTRKEVKEKIAEDLTNVVMAEQVQLALKGEKYNFEVEDSDQIIVMVVDAATTGRLAIVYYQELASKLFLENISHWHNTCKWLQSYYDAERKKWFRYIGTPSTYYIVESVYGNKADEKIKKELYTRLLPCIVDRARIPKDVVRTIFNRVKNPMSFKDDEGDASSQWNRTLNIACALINKLYEKEELAVTLDIENMNRDYLFGRLLGVAEVFERNELKKRGENRSTNAMRYFNAFSQRPARTWMTIRKQLHPYQLRGGENTGFYNKIIQDIESIIKPDDMNNNALGPLFLLGFSSQVQYFYTKKEKKEEIHHDSDWK